MQGSGLDAGFVLNATGRSTLHSLHLIVTETEDRPSDRIPGGDPNDTTCPARGGDSVLRGDPDEVGRVLLLYSGGLDTWVMLKWIPDQYGAGSWR